MNYSYTTITSEATHSSDRKKISLCFYRCLVVVAVVARVVILSLSVAPRR